jgi:hypothetical protein
VARCATFAARDPGCAAPWLRALEAAAGPHKGGVSYGLRIAGSAEPFQVFVPDGWSFNHRLLGEAAAGRSPAESAVEYQARIVSGRPPSGDWVECADAGGVPRPTDAARRRR